MSCGGRDSHCRSAIGPFGRGQRADEADLRCCLLLGEGASVFWQVAISIAAAQLLHRRRKTIVSTLGVALGVGFFIATSSVMSGSENDLVQRLVNNAPHITMKDEFRTAAKQPIFLAMPDATVELTNTKPREYLRGIKNYGAIVDELSQQKGVIAEAALTGQIGRGHV